MHEQELSSERQPKHPIRYVGFDMDGTIRDSVAGYTRLFGEFMHGNYGIEASKAAGYFSETAGQPTPKQIATLLQKSGITISPSEAFKAGNRAALYLGENSDDPPFPEVLDMFKDLKEKAYKTFVSSGQQEKVVEGFLKKSGLMPYVDFYAGIRPEEPEFKKGEPHFLAAARQFGVPFPIFLKETVFIGDTPTDMEDANTLGIFAIARLGTNTEKVLLGSGAKLVLPNFTNLSDILLSL